jgi:hypothetical protein
MKIHLLLAAATIASTQATTPDKPVTFLAQLYNSTTDCTGSYYAYIGSFGGCINRKVLGGGSAKMTIANVGTDFLTAWSEPDCKGTPFLVIGNDVECDALGGTTAQSWSNDQRVFG